MYICVYINTYTHTSSSADGHLGCLHVLDIVSTAAMDIRVHVSFWIMGLPR